jgi:hypothetical protein
MKKPYSKFTPEEDNFIKDNYLLMPIKRIANILKRSEYGTFNRLRIMQMNVPKEIKLKHILDSRIKPGNIPYNKGKTMPDHVREKASKTMFKKGNSPHNTRQIGEFSDRMDSTGIVYRYVKISDSNWQLFHRVTWEQHHGSIPKGYRIHFKDGNTLNCTIENLEILTPQEAMDRNRITNLPVEIQEVIKLKNKLNRKIKDHGTK